MKVSLSKAVELLGYKVIKKDTEECKLFAKLWHEFDNWVLDNWSEEWKDYYLREID